MRLYHSALLSSTSARTILAASVLAGTVALGTPAKAQSTESASNATEFDAAIDVHNSSPLTALTINNSFNADGPTEPVGTLPIQLGAFTLGITNMSGAGGLSVFSGGNGTLALTGTNSFQGGLTVSSSTVTLDGGAALGSGLVNLNSATLRLTNNATIANGISLTADGATFDTAGFDATVTGQITGPSPLIVVGSGRLTLTNSDNTYSGATSIGDVSTLQIGNGGTTGVLGSGNINNGGLLVFNRSDVMTVENTISDLDMGGGVILSGSVTQAGIGTTVLTGNNTYSGTTTISAGTLQVGAGGTTGTLGSGNVINNATLAFNRSDDLTVANSLSGTGQLRHIGDGTLELTGTNSYTGGTFIGGILKVSADANLGAATGDIAFSNGTLLLGSSFDLAAGRRLVMNLSSGVIDTNGHDMTVRSELTGNAYFVKDGLGTLTLLGPNTFTGRTIVAQGTMVANADSISKGVIENRSALVIDQATDAAMSQSIEGAGTLTKRGAGRLDLTGTSTLTGGTFVQQGNLAVNGSLSASGVTVESSGILSGTGTVGGITALAGGTVSPGNSIGTLNVAGNVTFGSNSFYQVEVNAAGQSDRIAATGTANLNGGTVQVLAEPGSYQPSTTYTILTAAGGRIGTFSGLTSNFAFLTPSLGYDANAVTLTLSRATDSDGTSSPVAFHSVARTSNQYNAADGVEALGSGDPLFAAVLGQSAAGARQAFDALSGEAHASAATSAFTDVLRVQDTILNRLSKGSQGQAGDMVPPTFDPRAFALWGTGFGSWGKVRGNGNAASMDTSTGGFIIGADAKVDETYRIGGAGGFLSTSFDIDGRLSSGSNETVFGSIYGVARWDAINVRLGALYAHHDVDVDRTIVFPGFSDRVGSSYDGSTLMAFGEVGYAIGLGGATLEPFLGASMMRLHMDGFQEEGGAAALTGYGRTYELGTTTLGLRAEAKLGLDLPLTLRGMVGWRHAFGDVNPSALVAFSGGVSSFDVAGVPIDRDALVAEAGLDWQIGNDMTLGVSYAGQIGERAQVHAVKGNFTWRFETR